MFSFFFNQKKNAAQKEQPNDWRKEFEDFQKTPRLPTLDSSKIRVLIFKESSAKKTLMFDSDALILFKDQPSPKPKPRNGKVVHQKNESMLTPTSSPKYQVMRAKQDVKMLGEMVFGSVAMVYKGSILKVHLIRSPPQLLMTKVFALRSRSAGVNFCDNEMSSCNSLSKPVNLSSTSSSSASVPASPTESEFSRSFSTPVTLRSNKSSFMNPQNSISLLAAPSWSTSDLDNSSISSSFLSLNGSPRDSQTGSFRHRFSRSQKTSFDSAIWRSRSEQLEELRVVHKQQPKIGVGIIFNLWDNHEDNRAFQDFFFSHYALFETQLQSLRVKIEKSFYLRQKFLDTAVEAVEAFRKDILRLCYTPRIIEPLWLNLTSTGERRQMECAKVFVDTFLEVFNVCENKESSYFLSNLVTAVLTHHLSWVNTVVSSEKNSKKYNNLNKHASSTIDILAKCRPYNPLWAQICDLYGCLGSSFKLARTVVVGKNMKLVKQILKFLTYFIRCCEIKENFICPEKQKDSSSRLSSSNWSDTLSLSNSQTSTTTHGWFERSCNIVNTNTNNSIHMNSTLDPFKDFDSYNHLDILSEQQDECVTPRTNDRNIIEKLKSMNMNTNKCYCAFLQALNKISDKSLRSYVNMEDLKKQELQVNNIVNGGGKAGFQTSKSCILCKTLEKGMFDEFCDKCRMDLQKSSIEVIDTVCLHCVKRLEDLKCKNLTEPTITCDCNKNTLDCSHNSTNNTNTVCQKKPSFVCYCCTPSTYGKLNVDLKIDTSQGSLLELDLDITPRARKSSDPIDVVPLNKNNTKFSNMRDSINSHDSGTEMENSVGSSSESFTRTNSLSSQSVGSQSVATDIDSDYCSVENEQLASTLIENSTLLHLPSKQLLLQRTDKTQQEPQKHSFVAKSFSTNTLKSSLESNLAGDDNLFTDQSTLDLDLERLKLRESDLPRTIQRLNRKNSGRYNHGKIPSIGRSMLAGYTEEYIGDFVLQGCQTIDQTELAHDLLNTVKYSVLDEDINDAVCIVADTDNWTCEVKGMSKRFGEHNQNTSCEPYSTPVYHSNIVSLMLESVKDLCSLNMPPNFCLLHIEEQLRDLFNKSKVFVEYIDSNNNDDMACESFMRVFGYHSTDIELLTAIGDTLTAPAARLDESLLLVT